MRSAIYRGRLRHRRFGATPHEFRKGIHLLYLDLEELTDVFAGRMLWSLEAPNWASFRRSDYFGPADTSLKTAVLDRVEQELGRRPTGRVALLTQVRTLGYLFNPVSFYYCQGSDGELDAILAEITNTPWGERHAYVLDARRPTVREVDHIAFRFGKAFHVSPFFDMDQTYEWLFSPPDSRLRVSMTNHAHGRVVFHADLDLERSPIGARSLAAALLRYPLQPLMAHLAIYWHAARLYLKRTPFFTHPVKRETAETHTP